jgi:hypothetical protein
MRALQLFALCLVLSASPAMAQRGGGGGRGGGMGGGGGRGGMGGGGFRGGMGGGGFRGGMGGGGFRGGMGGGFRGGKSFGFRGGFNNGFFRGFNRAYSSIFFNGFYSPYVWSYPFIGSYAYSPYYGSYPYGYDQYGYDSSYPAYNSSPNVTVIYPAQPQASTSVYVERARPEMREYDEYGQEVQPSASAPPSSAAASPIYLLAFKDHVIRAAASYWVEGRTLHYVTLEHDARQVPLSDVDRDLTLQLNHERRVTIQLPQ